MKTAVVIGLGTISSIHLQAIEANSSIDLIGVCDVDESCKKKAPEGVPFYTDYQKMICELKPDVAHICLPHYLHVPVSEYVASMGVHVFCEKPIALTREQGTQIVTFEEEHPELHMGICLQNRFNASIQELKKRIDSQEYGKVIGIKGLVPWSREKQYYDEKPWRGKWETAGGGCMINQSIHTLDLLYYLAGPIHSLKAIVGQTLNYNIEVEDSVIAHLNFECGAQGLFMATIANYANENVQITVKLEKATFIIMDNCLYQVQADGSKTFITEDERLPGTKFYYGAGHRLIIKNFYDALETNSNTYVHMKDAWMSISLIDAIQESGRTQKEVIVPSRI